MKTFLIIFCFFLCSCIKNNYDLIDLLNLKYSNLGINNPNSKKSILNEIETLSSQKKLDQFSFNQYSAVINKLNDGHVFLRNDLIVKDEYISDLKFIRGETYFIESCENSCSPTIPKGKYQILDVDGTLYQDWINSKLNEVYGSTNWGKKFRVSRLLSKGYKKDAISLSLISSNNEIIKTTLSYSKSLNLKQSCVDFIRHDNNIVQIFINNLWCEVGGKDTLSNFQKAWNQVLEKIKNDDVIILDLRENNGGGDEEVRLVYNTFADKNIILYRYKYLFQTSPGLKKYLFPFLGNIFEGETGIDWTKSKYNPSKKFLNNKIITLVSPGCFSSCEGLANVLKESGRSKLVGDTTHGAAGAPLFYKIKDTNFSINLPSCITYKSSGELFEGVGVSPNIFVNQEITNYSDSVLQFSLKN